MGVLGSVISEFISGDFISEVCWVVVLCFAGGSIIALDGVGLVLLWSSEPRVGGGFSGCGLWVGGLCLVWVWFGWVWLSLVLIGQVRLGLSLLVVVRLGSRFVGCG